MSFGSSQKAKVDLDSFFRNVFNYKIVFYACETLKAVKYTDEPNQNGFQMTTDFIINEKTNEGKLIFTIAYGPELRVSSKTRGFKKLNWNFGEDGKFCFYSKKKKLCGINAFIPNKVGSLEALYSQAMEMKTTVYSITVCKSVEKIKAALKSYRPVELYNTGQSGFHEFVCYDKQDERDDLGTCFLCYVERTDGQDISILPCQHRFHYHCTMAWLQNNSTCPLCNYPARKEAWYVTKDGLLESDL